MASDQDAPPPLHPAFTVSDVRSHVRVVLDSDNKVLYSLWATLFRLHARAFNVMSFIDGSLRSDDIDDVTWSRLDALVREWIYSTLSDDIATRVREPATTAREAWVRIENMFRDIKGATELESFAARTVLLLEEQRRALKSYSSSTVLPAQAQPATNNTTYVQPLNPGCTLKQLYVTPHALSGGVTCQFRPSGQFLPSSQQFQPSFTRPDWVSAMFPAHGAIDILGTHPQPRRSYRRFVGRTASSEKIPTKIEQGLHLGSLAASLNKDGLKELNITHILTVRVTQTPAYPDDFTYKTINIHDRPDVNIAQYFQECFDYIEEARSTGGGVLVHCRMGISRSPSIVIAYLMKKHGTSLIGTRDHVKNKRRIVRPNDGFFRQLQEYEALGCAYSAVQQI